MSYWTSPTALPCRRCGRSDRIYEVGDAEYGWSCNVVWEDGVLATEENGRNVEYFDHQPTQWHCGECNHRAASLRELVRVAPLRVGERVVLPHGVVGEVEAVLERPGGVQASVIIGGLEYESWELSDLPAPTAAQLSLPVR